MASPVAVSLALLGALLAVPWLAGDFFAFQLGLFLIYGIACQGIGLAWGRGGFLPLGQALFFGLGAYGAGGLLKSLGGGVVTLIALLVISVVIALFAFVVAWAVFRGRRDSGAYFSLITLAMVMIAEQLAGTMPHITGGFNGMSAIPVLFGLDPYGNFYYLIVGCVFAVTFLLLALNKLPAGLLMRAVADNEPRLQGLGFSTHALKAGIYAGSAWLAAVAGMLFAQQQGIVTPLSIGFLLSAELVIWSAVGGRFHVLGPLIGALIIGTLTAELRDRFAYWELAMALLFLVVVVKAPGGVAGWTMSLYERIRNLFPDSRPPESPGAAALTPVTTSRASGNAEALTFRNVHANIGSVQILNGVDLVTPDRGIVFLIGPNGAGKTSLIKAMTGELPIAQGGIHLGDQALRGLRPYQVLRRGLVRKFQVPSVFPNLTVRENLRLSAFAGRLTLRQMFRRFPNRWQSLLVTTLLDHPEISLLDRHGDDLARHLSQGHCQTLELLMAAGTQPRVLLLDEPCAGLSPQETSLVVDSIRTIQQTQQCLILIVEHDMSLVEALADQVIVLDQGRVLAQGQLAELRQNPAVTAVYAGGQK